MNDTLIHPHRCSKDALYINRYTSAIKELLISFGNTWRMMQG